MLPIGHTEYIAACRLSPDGKRVVSAGHESKIVMWDLRTAVRLAELQSAGTAVDDVAFSGGRTRVLGLQNQ